MNLLLVNGEAPYPPHGGTRMRVYQFMRALSERHALTLLAYQYTEHGDDELVALRKVCRLEMVPWQEPRQLTRMRTADERSARRAFWSALLRYRRPFPAQYFYTQPMRRRLRDLLAGQPFDAIQVEESPMMALLPARLHTPIVLSIHQVESASAARHQPRELADRIELLKLARFERKAFVRASLCCPTCEVEAARVRALSPAARVRVIANGVDTREFVPSERNSAKPTVVFSSTLSYAPNADGIVWFVREIWPLIRATVRDARLQIVGRDAPEEVLALAGEHVEVTGEVADVRPYLQDAWLAVAPLRGGGGTRLKILEALACALPVVSTAVGAEGLNVRHGEHILIAEGAREFADEVVRVLRDPALRRALGCAGRALVERQYAWPQITAELLDVYEALAVRQCVREDARTR